MDSSQIQLGEMLRHLAQLGFAFALALPIGWDRERSERSAGLRTFPLVAIGSCAFLLIGRGVVDVVEPDPHARAYLIYGLMAGIGFIAGGTILRTQASVRGTATAASIWNTGAIGTAVAWERYEIGVALAVVSFALLYWGQSAKQLIHEKPAEEDRPRER